MKRLRETDWWYWLVTDGLLIGSLAGWPWGTWPVIALTMFQAMHYLLQEKRIAAFPVQVRLGYLLLLVLGTQPYLGFIHWIQLAGTTAVVTVGYCPLARILALMPWNRSGTLTTALVWNTIVTPPVAGSILDVRAEDKFFPSGNLSLKLDIGWWGRGLRSTWSDGKRQRVDNCLNKFIATAYKAAVQKKAARIKREREEYE
jgi:hypothetical protein